MPFYLIRINRRIWDRDGYADWLQAGQAPADLFRDLRVVNGRISVWHIEDDKSNLDQVITALAVTRDNIDVFDYGLFDQMIVGASGIRTGSAAGDTPLHSANHWHSDLVELTVDNWAVLVKALFNVMETDRRSAPEIRTLILTALQEHAVELSALNDRLRPRIQSFLADF